MSAIIERFIDCDGCGENFGIDNRTQTIEKQRKDAKNNGWTHKNGKDYCPECKLSIPKETQ